MRLVAVALFALANSAFAGAVKIPAKHCYLEIRGKYGVQWTRVYSEGGEWICQTEGTPYYVAKRNPFNEINWKALQAARSSLEGCRDRVTVRDTIRDPARMAKGCLDDRRFSEALRAVHQACRP